VADTYVAESEAQLNNATYDSYIKAFRWASDLVQRCPEGGIVAFISNGGWLDGNSQDGFRKCLEREFDKIYVLNLRGDQRTMGERSQEGGRRNLGSGSRTPIAITFLVRKPGEGERKAQIFYHDIGDYLSREQKLRLVSGFGSIDGVSGRRSPPMPTATGSDNATMASPKCSPFGPNAKAMPTRRPSLPPILMAY